MQCNMPYVTWVLAQDLQVLLNFSTNYKLLSLRLGVWDFVLFQALGIFMLSSYIPMNKLSPLEEAIDQNLLATFLLVSLFSSIWFLTKSWQNLDSLWTRFGLQANVFTGMVNMAVDTIFASPLSSLVILTAYAFALSVIIGTIHFTGFRLKFW